MYLISDELGENLYLINGAMTKLQDAGAFTQDMPKEKEEKSAKDTYDGIVDRIKEMAKGIVDGIKLVFGIQSPSKVFGDQVGKNMDLELSKGFTKEMKRVLEQMQKSILNEFDTDLNF